MNVVLHKVWADLWGNKSRTLQVAMIIALGAWGMGLVIGAYRTTASAISADWTRSNPPALKISVSPPLDEDHVRALKNIDGIMAVEGLQSRKIEWRPGPGEPWQTATLNARDQYTGQQLSRWDLVAGAWPSGSDFGIERGFGAKYNIALGDFIETRIDGRVRRVKITGTLNAHDLSPTFSPDLVLYATAQRFGAITGQPGYNIVQAQLDAVQSGGAFNQARADQIDAAVRDRLHKLGVDSQGLIPVVPSFRRVASPQIYFAAAVINSAFLLLGMIGVLILIMGGLLIYNNVNAVITQQINQIGIMKAIGARTRQVAAIYVLLVGTYGLLACLVAVPLAALAAHGLKLFLLGSMDVVDPGFQVSYLAVGAQVVIAIGLPLAASSIPLFKGATITVREAISTFGLGGAARLIDRLTARLRHVSYTLLLTLVGVFRNIPRLTLTQIALVCGGLLFIAVMGVRDSISYTFGTALTDIHRYQINLNLENDERSSRITPLMLQQPGVRAVEVWNTGMAQVRPATQPTHAVTDPAASLFGIPAGSRMVRPRVVAGRWLEPGDARALVMHQQLAERVGIGVGDYVTLRYPNEREATWQVIGLYFDPALNTGVYVRQEVYGRELNRANKGNSLFIQTDDTTTGDTSPSATKAQAAQLKQVLEANHFTVAAGTLLPASTIAEIVSRRQEAYSVIVNLLALMAVVIGIVGGIGLSGTLSLSVMERTREIGVMRAIGASSRRIAWMFIGEGLIQSILSWLIAVPLGICAAQFMTTAVLGKLFGDTLLYRFEPTGIGVWLAIVLLLGMVASWLPARRATRISVRASLAYQ